MKIFFIGVTEFGYNCYNKMREMNYDISGCAYTDEKIIVKRQRGGIKNATYIDFKKVAEETDTTGVYFEKNNQDDFAERVRQLKPDLIVVAGWHYILPAKILSIPPLGTIGLHASLLPKYRGGSPLVWQLLNGEKEGGITLFYLEDGVGVDAGHVIGQKSFKIDEEDNIMNLMGKAQMAALHLIEQFFPLLEQGVAPKIKQDESQATVFRQRIPADGEINWNDSPENIRNFIKAQTKPYPGAFTFIGNKKITIWDADIIATDGE